MKPDIIRKFENTYGEFSDNIFRFCLSRISNREQARDITQETFLRLWQSIREEKDILNEKSFLFTVANHLIIDWYRKKKSISLEGFLANEEGSENEIPDDKTMDGIGLGAEGRFLLAMIEHLPANYRESVYLRYVEDLSPRVIGDILGISENAASVRINRGMIELRKKMNVNKK